MSEPNLQHHSLSMPTLSGHEQLRELVAAFGGEALVCSKFRISPELLRAYLANVMEVPYTTMLAIYWHGPYGFSQALSESHWANTANYSRALVAEAKVSQYRSLLQQLAPFVKGFETLIKSHGIEDMGERRLIA